MMLAMRHLSSRLPSLSGLVLAAALAALAACGTNDPGPDASPIDPDASTLAPDATVPGEGHCRTQTDCSGGGDICYGPNDTMCGIPPRQDCDDDSGCGGKGQVCHAIADNCSVDRIGSVCGPPCGGVTGCDDGFTCDATGHCRASTCGAAAGFACPPSQTCDPSSIDPNAAAHALSHGCVSIACSADAECPADTRCVNDRCQDDFGVCSPPVP
jgi:hypothetical protein